jgi:hypothetical protein
MGERNWFTSLVDRDYQADLVDLAISDRDGDTHTGQGRILLTPDRDIRVWAVTRGNDDLAIGRWQPGEFISRESRYTLKARALDGWSVEVTDIVHQPSVDLAYDEKIWDFPTRQATFTLPFGESNFHGIGAIVGPVDAQTYPRSSKLIYENPHFSYSREPLDWFEFETIGAKISGNQRGKHCFVKIEAELDLPGLERALESVQLAMSFVEGRNVGLSGYEARIKDQTQRKLFNSAKITQNRFPRPIGTLTVSLNVSEKVMGLATPFFLSERGRRYSDWLRMCWNSSDNYPSIHVLVLCSTIESFANDYRDQLQDASFTVSEKEIIQSLIQTLNANRERVGQGFQNRIKNYLGNLHKRGSQDVLREWADRCFLGFAKEDLAAFKRLRNPVAHGEKLLFIDPDIAKWEDDIVSIIRLQNFLNRFILHSMGYEGMYFDHNEHKPMNIVGTTIHAI